MSIDTARVSVLNDIGQEMWTGSLLKFAALHDLSAEQLHLELTTPNPANGCLEPVTLRYPSGRFVDVLLVE